VVSRARRASGGDRGDDALWTELAELAAVAGAQIHVHLDHNPANDPDAALRRLQVWSNLASFQTFSVMANVSAARFG